MAKIAVSESFISLVTERVSAGAEEWRKRQFEKLYAALFIDVVHFPVRNEGVIQKLATYVVLGIYGCGS